MPGAGSTGGGSRSQARAGGWRKQRHSCSRQRAMRRSNAASALLAVQHARPHMQARLRQEKATCRRDGHGSTCSSAAAYVWIRRLQAHLRHDEEFLTHVTLAADDVAVTIDGLAAAVC